MGHTIRINCQAFRNGECHHEEAPRGFFGGHGKCVLFANKDPRVKECALFCLQTHRRYENAPPKNPSELERRIIIGYGEENKKTGAGHG